MLILLPGLVCDDRVFAPQVRAFPDVHAVPGYGARDSIWDMARFVLAGAPERFALLGHSMGGRVALGVQRLAPERVERLALVSTGVHGVRPGEADKRAALQRIGYDDGFAALIDAWLPPMIARADPALAATLRTMCLEQGQPTFDAHVRALLGRPDATSQLREIRCPTLVLVGERDVWSPPDQHREMAEAITASRLVVVPGAGHMVTVEAPDAVNAAIAAWAESV